MPSCSVGVTFFGPLPVPMAGCDVTAQPDEDDDEEGEDDGEGDEEPTVRFWYAGHSADLSKGFQARRL